MSLTDKYRRMQVQLLPSALREHGEGTMIGGTIIHIVVLADRIWLNCEEEQSTSQSAIYVVKNADSRQIKRGDSIWWQGNLAYWTRWQAPGSTLPKKVDVAIPRIGFSGAKKPQGT